MEYRLQHSRLGIGSVHGPSKGSFFPFTRSLLSAALSQRNRGDNSQRGAGGVGIPSLRDGSARASQLCAALLSLTQQSAAQSAASSSLPAPIPSLGYQRNIDVKYAFGKELGKGGNGCVKVVVDKDNGAEYACKIIPKVPPATASAKKKEGHVASLMREIEVLTRLEGSLNVVELRDVYEDDQNVYIVQEWCKGGELWHAVGSRHYSERTVASYMRAVLRTLAQCHAKGILHRDIKPGNFMLLNDDVRSPLKAIDFGLAASFDPDSPIRSDLGLEGTPWYMAPETLRSEWQPASDVWAAGVMAFQLLTGSFPFDDHKNSYNPSISAIWKSVLCDDLVFEPKMWEGISEEARSFVAMLLKRDPAARPSAKDALKHPWLQGNSKERSTGKRLSASIVQSIQRYASNSALKRSVLQSIAAELLAQSASSSSSDEEAGAEADTCPVLHSVPAAPVNLDVLYRALDLCKRESVETASVAQALESFGFKLEPSEVARLVGLLESSGEEGEVGRATLLASQLDWRSLQRNHTEDWLGLARRAFQNLDADSDGVLDVDELITVLRTALPPDEVSAALRAVLSEAGSNADSGIDFDQFLSMLRVGSMDSLDIYDDAMSRGSFGSLDRLNSLLQASGADWTIHGDGSVRSAAAVGPGSPQPTSTSASTGQPWGPAGSSTMSSNAVMAPTAFRFDVGPTMAHPASSIAASAFRFDVGPVASPGPPQPQPAAATAFRFDVGPASVASQPAAQAGTAFRFDVAASSALTTMEQRLRGLTVEPGQSSVANCTRQQEQQKNASLASIDDGGGSGLLLPQNSQDESPECRLHGGNLYRVAVLNR